MNVARTCDAFPEQGGTCNGLAWYPNATINHYGTISGPKNMMAELYQHGPIACGIDAEYILKYVGGIIVDTPGERVNHVVSVTGWNTDNATGTRFWWTRNSWGEYWGEMGWARVGFGNVHIEYECAWADVGYFTERSNQHHHAWADGSNVKAEDSECGVWCESKV